ncbi:MAG: hypothetical protein U1B78_02430, partial [Dehalococcoidia bacterium]|nr:hypothetical protein [Dehalococcoidia bacterium]
MWYRLTHGRLALGALLLAGLASALVIVLPGRLSSSAQADGGDFSLDFIAAAPETYVHQGPSEGDETSPGGLQFDHREMNTFVRESLEAEDFFCGDRVVFFTEVTADDGATGSQTIDLLYDFDALNNGQPGVGYSDVLDVGISNADFPGQTDETGHSRSGNESASLQAGPTFFPGSDPTWDPGTHESMRFTARVSGLEADEVVIVRLDARFSCFGDPTGNLHAAIDSAEVVAGGSGTINVGQQDIPMLGLGELVETPAPTDTPVPPTATPTPTEPAGEVTATPAKDCSGYDLGDVQGPKAKPFDVGNVNSIDAALILQFEAGIIDE